VRSFKGIIYDDISEFESHMPNHAVGLSAPSWRMSEGARKAPAVAPRGLFVSGPLGLLGDIMLSRPRTLSALEAMLHGDLLYTHSSGVTDTKATWLQSMQSGKTKYKSVNCTDRKVRVIGEVGSRRKPRWPRAVCLRAQPGGTLMSSSCG
jgi:Domain of unknown function (DUF4440)